MDDRKKSVDRLLYAKPRVRIISLVAEEVLATSCKRAVGQPVKTNGCGNASCKGAGGS